MESTTGGDTDEEHVIATMAIAAMSVKDVNESDDPVIVNALRRRLAELDSPGSINATFGNIP